MYFTVFDKAFVLIGFDPDRPLTAASMNKPRAVKPSLPVDGFALIGVFISQALMALFALLSAEHP